MHSNRIRVFSELVSLEAWHAPFANRRTSVGLHADVTFSTARLGEEIECPVRFKMRLKQAILTVNVPETEAVTIDRSSVARFDIDMLGVQKTRRSNRAKAAGSVGLAAKGSINGGTATGAASLDAGRSAELAQETTVTTKFNAIQVRHSLDVDGNNRWTFTPSIEENLNGKPWAPKKTPLMKLKDAEAAGKRKLGPSVRLELTCLREDLDIFDIELKDKSVIPLKNLTSAKRKIAAEAFIRTRLQEEGLPVPLMTEDFATIILARANSIES